MLKLNSMTRAHDDPSPGIIRPNTCRPRIVVRRDFDLAGDVLHRAPGKPVIARFAEQHFGASAVQNRIDRTAAHQQQHIASYAVDHRAAISTPVDAAERYESSSAVHVTPLSVLRRIIMP